MTAPPSGRLNILYVGTLPPHPGGSAISGYQLLTGCLRAGHRVRAVAPIAEDALARGDQFAARYPEMPITRLVVPHPEIQPYFPYPEELRSRERDQVLARLGELVAAERPDVILIGRETYAGYVPDLSHALDLPCLLVIRGGLTHGLLDGTYPHDFAAQLLDNYRKADAIVTPGKHMAASLKRFGLDISVIPNGVDLNLFSPVQDLGLRRTLASDEEVIVCLVAHLRDKKRPLDLVYAAHRALASNSNLVFVIVGNGPFETKMQQACKELGIADKFRFLGWAEQQQVAAYLNAADIVAMPSEAENQARVYLEAMACARTLVASDIAAAREVIVDNETGLLFKVGDIQDLAAKILYTAARPELRRQIGRKARGAVRAHATERVTGQYLCAMRRLVEQYKSIGV